MKSKAPDVCESPKALDTAIKEAGGLTALAEKMSCTPQVINNWRTRGVPAERCAEVETATEGAVTKHDLRPDIFDPPVPPQRAAKAASSK